MTCLDKLKDFYRLLTRAGNKEIFVLDFQKARRGNMKDLPHVKVEGVVIDSVNRIHFPVGDSHVVSLPEGWLKSINNETRAVTPQLILLGDDTRVILISKTGGSQ